MKTVVKTFGIITIASSLLFGQVATSLGIGGLSNGPTKEPAPLIPAGTEFPIDTGLDTVAMDGDGNFVVVGRRHNGETYHIFGQGYTAAAIPMGVEFQVDTNPAEFSQAVEIDMNNSGNFAVVWESALANGDMGVFAQLYDSLGNPFGIESFLVNNPATHSYAWMPDIAVDENGNVTIVWCGQGIWGQRYDSTGNLLGNAFLISPSGLDPAIAMTDTGAFVVVWDDSHPQEGVDSVIFGRRYDNLGNPLAAKFQVNTTMDRFQSRADVAIATNGNFMVVWQVNDENNKRFPDIYGQRYNAPGIPLGSEFQVNTTDNNDSQTYPAIAVDDSGNMMVVWGESGSNSIFGQRYDVTGQPIEPEFQVGIPGWVPGIAISRNKIVVVGDGFGKRYTTDRAPTCDAALPVPSGLFSNDHAFNVIDIANVSDPEGEQVTITVNEIYQDETVNAAGSGFTAPDGKGIGTNAAEVRDEHVSGGNGRTYRINFTAEDESNLSCSGMVLVRSNPKTLIDGNSIVYDSTITPKIVGELLNPNQPTPPGGYNPTAKVTP